MLYFRSCVLCKSACHLPLCQHCRRDLTLTATSPARCPQCAAPANGICGQCLHRPPAFDSTIAALNYTPSLSLLIRRFKFYGHWYLARLLAEFIQMPQGDVVLPAPLFPTRERWRGFNQAREIAKAAPMLPAPLDDAILSRIVDTTPQSQLPNAAARRRNVSGAFKASNSAAGKTIIVIDDVMTSGATLNEIAIALKKSNAAKVINVVIARATVNN